MKASRRSINIVIVSIYILTLFCGLGRIIDNNIINIIRKILMMGLPSIISVSFIIDNIKNLSKLKEYKAHVIFICANIIWYLLTIIFGINIGIQSLIGIVNFSNIIILLFFMSQIKFDEEDRKRIFSHFIYSALICSIYGILQYIFKFDLNIFANEKYPGILGRIPSTFYLPTIYDKYLIIMYAIALYKLVNEKNIKYSVFAFLLSINIILTFGRSALISYMIVTFFFLIKSFVNKRYINVIIPLSTLVIAFLIPGFVYSFQSTINYGYSKLHIPTDLRIRLVEVDAGEISDISKDHSLNDRKYYNNIGIEFIKERPVLGIGLNNYSYLYNNQNASEYLKNTQVLTKDYMYPHSAFVMITAEIGVVGSILMFTYIAFICYDSFKNKKYFPIIILLLFIFNNYTENLISNKQYMYIFVLLYGILCNTKVLKKK